MYLRWKLKQEDGTSSGRSAAPQERLASGARRRASLGVPSGSLVGVEVSGVARHALVEQRGGRRSVLKGEIPEGHIGVRQVIRLPVREGSN